MTSPCPDYHKRRESTLGYVNLDLRTDLPGCPALLKCAEGIVIPLPDPEERRRLLQEAYDMVLQVLESNEPDERS